MNPYADQSGNEFSLHGLSLEQLKVLKDSISITYRKIKHTDTDARPTRINLEILYKAIDECLQERSGT